MTADWNELEARFSRADATVGIVGLGAVGIPLAAAFLRAGFRVVGFDRDPRVAERLAAGERTFAYQRDEVWDALRAPEFDVATDAERLAQADAVLLCVPTPLAPDRTPDLSCVHDAAVAVARHLRRGQLVVLESTTWPGTTRQVVAPLLAERGLREGEDYLLAYSPEREDPGRTDWDTRSTPKLVGGLCATSTRLAAALYGAACKDVRPVGSAEVAESAKLLENVFRSVNIALVNEMKVALERMGVDVWEVLAAAETKPFGYMRFDPGPGMGGHCIPIDPFYMAWTARRHGVVPRLIETAGEINTAMPAYVVERLEGALNERGVELAGASVLVLGLAYKRDVDVVTETPGMRLIELLRKAGARAAYADPHVALSPTVPGYGDRLASRTLSADELASHDACILATDHGAFDYDLIAEHARLVVDTRNVLAERMRASGRYVRA